MTVMSNETSLLVCLICSKICLILSELKIVVIFFCIAFSFLKELKKSEMLQYSVNVK